MTETPVIPDPAAAFASLMSGAADLADQKAIEAPYGYTKDPKTGEMRPKKTAGRPKKSPSLEELKTEVQALGGETGDETYNEPDPDRAPEERKSRKGRPRAAQREPAPAYKAGIITVGVNRLYRRAGKIVRAMDEDIGEAIIQSARNTADDGEPDDSVGAAWDELARTNPRVRRFIMKVIKGGAVGQLIMAHAPIGMAIVMKPAILKLIPFSKLIESMAEPDEDTLAGEGGLPGGMTAADVGQMAALAERQAAKMGLSLPPEVAERMAAAAQSMANGSGAPVPAGAVRQQPPRPPSRARRKAG